MDSFSKKVKNIIEGHYNNLSGGNEELGKERLNVCSGCAKFHKNFCLTSRGRCGCYLPAKTKVEDEECPDKKWLAKK